MQNQGTKSILKRATESNEEGFHRIGGGVGKGRPIELDSEG